MTGEDVGLFSLFRRNGAPQEPEAVAPRQPRDAEGVRRQSAGSEAERQDAQERQRELARATALKIDAIEAAMAFDIFNTPEPAWGSEPQRVHRPAPPDAADGTTLAQLDAHTTERLGEQYLPGVGSDAQAAPLVEEIAILYANGQLPVAEQMLLAGLADVGADRTVWWMLFDLYQVTDQQEQFDNLSIDYASKFETSPPAWVSLAPQAGSASAYAGVTPTLALAGHLDAAIEPALQRLQQLAPEIPVVRLEFSKVAEVDPAGCALLLQCLQTLQAQQRELILVGAAELSELIRSNIRVGHREDGEACWLLLLELLQLLHHEKEFEEAGMDYCVTFEVSPPSFIASSKVATAAKQYASASSDRFMLPAMIEGDSGILLNAIKAYGEKENVIVFDCSRLLRIDFHAAGLLLNRLQNLHQEGKRIEFRDVNHLVAALLRLLAFSDLAKIFPHKY
ncbi:ABC-type transporter Mla MlaB component [Oxalobacteraceae bacterium GrIS 1.11]